MKSDATFQWHRPGPIRSLFAVVALSACASAPAGRSSTSDAAAADAGETDAAEGDAAAADAGETDAAAGDASADAGADGASAQDTGLDCSGVPVDASSTAPVCGTWTLGVGTACDQCVSGSCGSIALDECCHRGAFCGDPTYEYRLMLSHCIVDRCTGPCYVACEGWPLSP